MSLQITRLHTIQQLCCQPKFNTELDRGHGDKVSQMELIRWRFYLLKAINFSRRSTTAAAPGTELRMLRNSECSGRQKMVSRTEENFCRKDPVARATRRSLSEGSSSPSLSYYRGPQKSANRATKYCNWKTPSTRLTVRLNSPKLLFSFRIAGFRSKRRGHKRDEGTDLRGR